MPEPHEPRFNILLVYPEAPKDSYWSFSHSLKMIGKKAAMPPLGLLTVAAMLPADEFSPRLVDMNVGKLSDADIEWADVVFVSAMIVQKESLEKTLSRIKRFGKTVVAGGPYTSTAYAETKNVDCFLIGEAEGVWEYFLADLRNGTLRPAYAAPVRQGEFDAIAAYFGGRAHLALAESLSDINRSPLPRFDLLKVDDYSVMTVQASRGCPVGCEFCDIWRRFGRSPRNKRPERILAELDELRRLGWNDAVFIVDDNFIGNKSRASEMLHALLDWQKRHGWPFAFLTETTLSLADDDAMLRLMADSGFTSVFVGIETPCEESLRETRKFINTRGSLAEKVEKIQRHGMQVMSGFIIGFDADPKDIADRMIACIQDMGIPQAMIGLLNALPDTDLHDRLAGEKRLLGQTTGNNTHNFAMNFAPARPAADVVADYKRILQAAYPPDMANYYRRCSILRERWPGRSSCAPGKLPLGVKVRAFFLFLLAALRSSYRFSAFRFLASTLLFKPSYLEQAITLGVKGHHLWAITRQAFEAEKMRVRMDARLSEAADFLQQKQSGLRNALGRLIPDTIATAEELPGMLAAIGASCAKADVSEELRKAFRTFNGILKEMETYKNRIQKETEREFRHLSRETRKMLEKELDAFLTAIGDKFEAMLFQAGPAEAV